MSFVHPALPKGMDAIRLLTIEPGDFMSPLSGSITSVAFSSRPKYVALSYTWSHSYWDNSRLPISINDSGHSSHSSSSSPERPRSGLSLNPVSRRSSSIDQRVGRGTSPSPGEDIINGEIMLNGSSFPIGHNLHLALLHIRSPLYPVDIWIDAICINQADEHERNRQVSLMTFIYTRALRVVAWIGTKGYPSMTGLFRSMSLEWKAGQTQHFAAFLAEETPLRCSKMPDQRTFARMIDSAYWRRIWIVQEMCLPRLLLFMYGSDIWTYEEFKNLDHWRTTQPEARLSQSSVGYPAAARQLLETRDRRHTNIMRLENLVERFARNDCSEVRDRIYGLLGCANDVRPFAERDDVADALEMHIDALRSGLKSSYKQQRGMGWLRIDYSCTFYNLWVRVVSFAYFQARYLQSRTNSKVDGLQEITMKDAQNDPQLLEERQLNIVRIAGIIQNALSGKVEEEMTDIESKQEWPAISALGFIAGTIIQFGPEYLSLMSSSAAAQDWTNCWTDHYHNDVDLETLRIINEEFTAKILGYKDADLARVRNMWNRHVSAWPVGGVDGRRPTDSKTGTTEDSELQTQEVSSTKGPRIFLGTSYVMGLAPSAAAVGDVVVRFWNCNAALLMRPMKPRSGVNSYMLLGRVDVAEVFNSTKGESQTGSAHPDAVNVDFDLRTLQRITANITT